MTLVYFHEDFLEHYSAEPAAAPGRLEPSLNALRERYPVVQPSKASEEDVLRVHTGRHLNRIARQGDLLYHTALVSLGSVKDASRTALEGEIAFALCRPPGHHAGRDYNWGFCYFNNVAAAVAEWLELDEAEKALIVDFDLHFGDGTEDIFKDNPRVTYWHGDTIDGASFTDELQAFLSQQDADILAVSAGFDRHVDDWGGMLTTEDYGIIGRLLGDYALRKCRGRVFAALEGGYNRVAQADGVMSFLEGLEEGREGIY